MRKLSLVRTTALSLLAALAVATARAEDVVTKTNGAKLRGKIVAENSEEVRIKTAAGVISIPRDEVESVERAQDVFSELAARQEVLRNKPSAAGWIELAKWCQSKRLWVAATDALKAAVRVDPENAEARVELGYRKLGAKWVTESEFFESQGYIHHEGRWISPADKEKLDQGLVPWGESGEWIPASEAERREKDASAEAERERRGIPTSGAGATTKPEDPGEGADKPEKPEAPAKPEKPEKPARKGAKPSGPPRYWEGKLLYTKTIPEIMKALDQIDQDKIAPLTPAKKVEFEPLDSNTQIAALRVLRSYRYMCDLPYDVELNEEYAETCTAGAKLLGDYVGHLDHTPPKPPACPDALYKRGYEGTSHSNLFMGLTDCREAVRGFIYDSDPSNIDRVGHRRWCLNPTMKATAFGMYKQFITLYAFDRNRPIPTAYDAVLYPSRGYFPTSYLRAGAAWSANLAPRFAPAVEKDVKVTVSPIDANMKKGPALELDYFHVDNQGFGTGSSCVIFRPKGISITAGARYWVEIKGLKEPAGADAPLEYMVEFFQP